MVEPEPGGWLGLQGRERRGAELTHGLQSPEPQVVPVLKPSRTPRPAAWRPLSPPSIQTARLVWSCPFSPHCIPWNALHPPLASGAPEGRQEAPRVAVGPPPPPPHRGGGGGGELLSTRPAPTDGVAHQLPHRWASSPFQACLKCHSC